MTENEPPRTIDLGPRPTPPIRWNVEGMAEALQAKACDVVHDRPTFGAGVRLELEGTDTALEMWEHVYYVRAEAARTRVEAIGVRPTTITEEQVVFEGVHDDAVTRLSVARGGTVVLFSIPREEAQVAEPAAAQHHTLPESSSGSAEPAHGGAGVSAGAAADAAEELPEGASAAVPEGPFQTFPAPPPRSSASRATAWS